MANQTLKYGLTTALRSFEFPKEWDCAEQLIVKGATATAPATTFKQNEFLGTQHNGELRGWSIPAGYNGEVQFIRTLTGNCAVHRYIHVGTGAKVKILDEIYGGGSFAMNTQIIIEPNAHVEFAILQDMKENANAFLNYEATIADGKLHWFFCGIGGETTQANIATNAGNNADVINNAVIFGTGKQQFDIHVATNHTGPGSKSDMLTRSVLDEQARAVYHGLIHIGQDAPECDSYQKDEVILLSESAGADAIPNLEIQNNRVRCTHGASIGKMDEEKLFYFLSRGITKQEAKKMITEGFLEPLFIAPWQNKVHTKIR